MTISSGKVLARRAADDLCFLVLGRVTSHHSPAMRRYAEEGLACGAARVEVDLRDCTYCDSTFLGTLLHLMRCCDSHNQKPFRLVCPSAEVRQILAQIGAERLFCIVNEATTTDLETTWQQLSDNLDRIDSFRFKENVVDAHLALANAGGALGQRFGPLAESMSRELDIQRSQQAENNSS